MSIFKIRSNWKFIVIVIGNLKDVIINRLIGIFGRLFFVLGVFILNILKEKKLLFIFFLY